MAASDVFVLASEVEAGGTVLAEAQALGLACVATPTWAGRFMVEPETGVVLPAAAQRDDDALVTSLTEALAQVTDSIRAGGYLPEEIRARARQRFGEATFVTACRELYEQACNAITGALRALSDGRLVGVAVGACHLRGGRRPGAACPGCCEPSGPRSAA